MLDFEFLFFNFDLCSTIWVTRVTKNNTELNIGNDWPQAWPVLFTFGPIYKSQTWQVC